MSTIMGKRIHFDSNELIVNSKPDIPLKVPIERASIAASLRVEELKKKNL